MRRLGRRTSWLGWAVAGVLLVAAGGAALAAQDATTTTQAPSGGDRPTRTGRGPGRWGVAAGWAMRWAAGCSTAR